MERQSDGQTRWKSYHLGMLVILTPHNIEIIE